MKIKNNQSSKINDNGGFQEAWEMANDREKEILLDIARDAQKRELEFLWQRTQFFWTLNGVALAGVGIVTQREIDPIYPFTVSIFGLVMSFSWTLINRGSKYWYENWEKRLKHIKIIRYWMKPAQDRSWWNVRFSPSKILIAISDIIFGFWFTLTFYQAGKLAHISEIYEKVIKYIPSDVSKNVYVFLKPIYNLIPIILPLALLVYISTSFQHEHDSEQLKNDKNDEKTNSKSTTESEQPENHEKANLKSENEGDLNSSQD